MYSDELIREEETTVDRHGRFFFNVNLVFSATIVVNIFSFLIVVVIARTLGPEGRGVTSLYQTGVNLAYAFITFGVAIGALYFVSRLEVSAREALEAGLGATIASAALGAAGAAVLYAVVGDELKDADVPIWLVVIAIPLVLQFRLVESVVRAQGRFMVVSIVEALIPLIVLIGLVAVDAFDELTVGKAIVIWSLSPLPSTLIAYALGTSSWPRGFGSATILRKLSRFGLQGQVRNIIQTLNYRLDSYMVLFFVNSAGVGLYAVGVSFSEGLLLLANSIAIVLIPKLTAADPGYAAEATPDLPQHDRWSPPWAPARSPSCLRSSSPSSSARPSRDLSSLCCVVARGGGAGTKVLGCLRLQPGQAHG
jgi:O-antigen/teichoic acid export membrane protein